MTTAFAMANVAAAEFDSIKPVMTLMADTADGVGDADCVAHLLYAARSPPGPALPQGRQRDSTEAGKG